MSSGTQGERIRALFGGASAATIVAPFMKVNALRSVLGAIPNHVPLRCVTRWLPQEVASGVSDPEVLQVLQERGNAQLSIVDRLHAKLYIADDICLAGSANVTLAGFGEVSGTGNIEVLVETSATNPDIRSTLEAIRHEGIEATEEMARAVRSMANTLLQSNEAAERRSDAQWFPVSRHPEKAYPMYLTPATGFMSSADRILLNDLARCNLTPGLSEEVFREAIRTRLQSLPIANPILDGSGDLVFTKNDAEEFIVTMTTDEWSSNDIWLAFVRWMVVFFSDRVIEHQVTELALRRAQQFG